MFFELIQDEKQFCGVEVGVFTIIIFVFFVFYEREKEKKKMVSGMSLVSV